MKKLIFSALATAAILTSCQDKNSYKLEGSIANADFQDKATMAYLNQLDTTGRDFKVVDSVVVEKNAFAFAGVAAEPQLRFITLKVEDQKTPPLAMLAVAPGDIKVVIDSITTVTGGTINTQLQSLNDEQMNLQKKAQDLFAKHEEATTDEERTAIEDEFNKLRDGLTAQALSIIKDNANNEIGAYLYSNYYYSLEPKEAVALFNQLDEKLRTSPMLAKIGERFQTLENVAEGKNFVDVKGLSPEGKELALSDYAGKNKLVLIDFWASWCGPCVKDMPHIVQVYSQYKAKGLEIVGISLDQDGDAWKQAIKTLNMTWPQMSDLAGWKSLLSQPYAVNSIPHTVLLDENGIIIANGLRGDKLDKKLEELLGK